MESAPFYQLMMAAKAVKALLATVARTHGSRTLTHTLQILYIVLRFCPDSPGDLLHCLMTSPK